MSTEAIAVAVGGATGRANHHLSWLKSAFAGALFAFAENTHPVALTTSRFGALVRLPAQRRSAALGLGAINAYVVAMVELIAASSGPALQFFKLASSTRPSAVAQRLSRSARKRGLHSAGETVTAAQCTCPAHSIAGIPEGTLVKTGR